MNAKWKRNLQYIPVFCVLVLVGLIILILVIWMTLCAFKPVSYTHLDVYKRQYSGRFLYLYLCLLLLR